MLVLTRKRSQSIIIDGVVEVTVLEVTRGGVVRLGVKAPRSRQVYRKELFLEIQAENRQAAAEPVIGDGANAAARLLGLGPGLAGTGNPGHT